MSLQAINHTKVLNSCQQILVNILGNQITISPDSESRYSSNLTGYNYFGATDRGRLVKVVPFYKDFWLHFSIQFDVQPKSAKKYDYFLAGVSIAIFYGQAVDNDKLLMFRAEWDNKKEEQTAILHPQPHWHVHNSGSDISAENISDFNIYISMKDDESNAFLNEVLPQDNVGTDKKIVDLSGFHFAMSAGWMFEKPYNHTLTEATLKVWLKESISHIYEQIEYCQ